MKKNNSILEDLSLDIGTDTNKYTKYSGSTNKNIDDRETPFANSIKERYLGERKIMSDGKKSVGDSRSTANFKAELSDQKNMEKATFQGKNITNEFKPVFLGG